MLGNSLVLASGFCEDKMQPSSPAGTGSARGFNHMMPPGTRQLVRQQIQSLQLLQQRPVILVTPFAVHVR